MTVLLKATKILLTKMKLAKMTTIQIMRSAGITVGLRKMVQPLLTVIPLVSMKRKHVRLKSPHMRIAWMANGMTTKTNGSLLRKALQNGTSFAT